MKRNASPITRTLDYAYDHDGVTANVLVEYVHEAPDKSVGFTGGVRLIQATAREVKVLAAMWDRAEKKWGTCEAVSSDPELIYGIEMAVLEGPHEDRVKSLCETDVRTDSNCVPDVNGEA